MGKKRKHEENGMTSMPRDEMPLGRSSDASHYSFCDALKQFEKHIQVKVNTDELVQKLELRVQKLEDKAKVNTDELVQKLELRVQKLEDKVKRNKNKEVQEKERISKIEEDLRTELNQFKKELRFEFHQEIRKLEENIENRSSQCFSVLKQDFKKELEVKDEPSLGIQEEGWAKVHHLNESPSLRSQPHQSETTRFKLKIQNKVDQVVYKGKPIRTDDSEHITVVLYDGDNPITPDHHLASAQVQLVVVDGEFNEPQGFWSKDDFEKKKTTPRQGSNRNLVKNGSFKLVDGKCRHKGVTITENSNRKEFMLGVMIVGGTNERVLGGLSNTFRVQEAKTEKDRAKRNTDDSTEDFLRYPTGEVHMTNKNGQGQRYSLQQTRPNFPSMANPQMNQAFIVQAANKRHSSGSVDSLMANGLPQQGTSQLENRGQGQQFQTTGPMLSFMQNHSQIKYGPTAGNGSVGPPFDHLQLYATQQSAQLTNYGQGRQHNIVLPPLRTLAVTPPQITYAHLPAGNGPGERVPRQNATQQGVQLDNHGNGSVDPVPVGHLQQYPTQQSTMLLDNHGQGRQHNSGIPTTQVNSVFMPNLQQRDHLLQQNTTQQGVQLKSHGNGSVDPRPVEHLQQYPTQQGINQQENYGQSRQHNTVRRTFPFAHAAAGNGPGGELENATQQGVQLDNHGNGSVDPRPVEHLQQYPTQQGINQQENYGQSRQHNTVRRTFPFAHAAAGNGPGGELENATQQGVQLDNHGQGRQHTLPTSQTTYTHVPAGNGPGGELENATQQGVQLDNHGSDLGLDLGLFTRNIPTGLSAGDVPDNFMDETQRHLPDNLATPDDPECSGLFHHAVAADQGELSAGTRQWDTNQLHMDYSAGMSGFHPATEDGGSTVSAPRTSAPAPEGTQMDFTPPTAMAPWEP